MQSGVSYQINATFDTNVSFEYAVPDGTIYTHVQDGDGNVVLTKVPLNYVQTDIISTKPVPNGIPSSPVLNMERSYGTYIKYLAAEYGSTQYMVKTIHVSWEASTDAEYYNVYLITNDYLTNSVADGTENDANPTPGYSRGVGINLFSLESGPLYSLDFNYTFDVNDYSPDNAFPTVTAFVFAYNELYGRSAFPLKMMSFVADGKHTYSATNTLFIEKTSYRRDTTPSGESINFDDGTTNIGGATANLESKAMPEYVYVPVTSSVNS